MTATAYCPSRFAARRRKTVEVMIGNVALGKSHPIRLQSMTTTPTQDVEATVRQSIALVEAGCEIVRITAQNVKAAQALEPIARKLREAKIDVPLVADIHFLPSAAMEAAKHVEKVRINPGNYADKKKFQVREYSDSQYEEELQRLYEDFSPIVKRCRELGRAMRIGTNHGSLSDRIMNRYGDSPTGMVESALEFVRICESHGFGDIVLSLKASNPKVMIEAYRLVVARMSEEGMAYPLHLGVTEAGDGEDARIKSAIGIGSLLFDGLGDTIRVSLTEDPVAEIPVAMELAEKAMGLWEKSDGSPATKVVKEAIDLYQYARRPSVPLLLGPGCPAAEREPPRVIVAAQQPLHQWKNIGAGVRSVGARLRDAKLEGLMVKLEKPEELEYLSNLQSELGGEVPFFVVELDSGFDFDPLRNFPWRPETGWVVLRRFTADEESRLEEFVGFTREKGLIAALDIDAEVFAMMGPTLKTLGETALIFTLSKPAKNIHPIGCYRLLAQVLNDLNLPAPIWIRCNRDNCVDYRNYFGNRLLEASILSGSLLCDGIGDLISVENEADLARATALGYNMLQGARARISKTEYVACPSCGRTLFDLQSTTQKIRQRTNHLKGVTIAIMGCIVNGPGEMADADFGYVGGAPGKVNLYCGKQCVKFHIPEDRAVDELIGLIKEYGKWKEPEDAEELAERS